MHKRKRKPLIYKVWIREREWKLEWKRGEEVSGQLAFPLSPALLADCLTDGGWQWMLNEVSGTQAVTCAARKRNTWVTLPQHLENTSYSDTHICQLPHTSLGHCFPRFPRGCLPENNKLFYTWLLQITRSNFQGCVLMLQSLWGLVCM